MTEEQLRDDTAWFIADPAIDHPLDRIDSVPNVLLPTLSHLEEFTIQVHRTLKDLARGLGRSPSGAGNVLFYTARISRPPSSAPEVHHVSRFFNPADTESFREACRSSMAAYHGIDLSEERDAEDEMQDDIGELRYERAEDIEGWETEEEWW